MCQGHYDKLRRTGVLGGPLRRRMTKLERYASFVDHRGPDDCWPWTGSRLRGGYGSFDSGSAHRFGFSQLVRPLESDEDVDHTCHNGSGCPGGNTCEHRACQNPAHWEAVPGVVNVLRGESVWAVNARKAKCKWGHDLTPENSYGYHGRRQCKTCARLASRGQHPRQLAAAGRLF